MFVIIGITSLIIYAGLVYYIGWNGYRWLRPERSSSKFKILYITAVVIAAGSFIIGRMSGVTLLSKIGAYWMAIFYLLLLLVPVAHISVIVLRLTRLQRSTVQKRTGIVTLVLMLSLLLYGTYNAYDPRIRPYSIQMERGHSSMDTLTIAMAADTHFGLLSGKDHAMRLVKEINAMKPDIILLPGDLIDDDIQPFLDQKIDEVLSELGAPLGVYASLGNHDRHNGKMQELIDTIEQSGITVLYDDAVTINDQLTVIGRKDRSDPSRLDLEQIMKEVDLSKPVILLDHQPYDLDIAQKAGIDLMLSGHTHHGQVFPGNFITASIYENDWGYLKKVSMHSIVTGGFGFWGPPIRIGTRSEIVKIQVDFVPSLHPSN